MGTGIPVMSCYGGRPAMDEHRTMKSLNPQVIIGTPGRMNDHLNKGNIDASHVHTLVIDEFDKCLEMGFQEEMSEVIAQIPYLKTSFPSLGHRCASYSSICIRGRFFEIEFLGR